MSDDLEAQQARIEELERERFCQSVWKCDKCGFQLTKSILYAKSGNIGADNRDHLEPCPNDGRDMRRMTWEEMFRDAIKCGEQQVERACKAEEERDQLKQKLTDAEREREEMVTACRAANTRMEACVDAICDAGFGNTLEVAEGIKQMHAKLTDAVKALEEVVTTWKGHFRAKAFDEVISKAESALKSLKGEGRGTGG
jgi:hypothetical protein